MSGLNYLAVKGETAQHEMAVKEDDVDDVPASELARDAYGVGILCSIQGFDAIKLATTNSDLLGGVLAVLWGLFILVLNFIIQIFLMWYSRQYVMEPLVDDIQEVYADYHDSCFDDDELSASRIFSLDKWHEWDHDNKEMLCQLPLAQPYFFLTVLLLWSFVMVAEVRVCYRVTRDVINLPSPPHGVALIKVFEGGFGIVMYLRLSLKIFIMALVILPKLGTAIVLWYVGSRWLTTTTEFGELILNSCAISFIVQIDEIIYDALIPEAMQLQVERTRIYTERLHRNEVTRVWKTIEPLKYIISLGWFAAAMITTYLYIFRFQHVLPNFGWDLGEGCDHFHY